MPGIPPLEEPLQLRSDPEKKKSSHKEMTDPKILSSIKLLFPVRDECGEAVVGQGEKQRISITYMGKNVEDDVEAPTQEKGKNVPEGFFLKDDQEQSDDCTPDDKGVDGPGDEGIPDRVP